MLFVYALGAPASGLFLFFAHIMSSLEAIEAVKSGICQCITHFMPSKDATEAPGTGLCTQTAIIKLFIVAMEAFWSPLF